MTKLNFYLDNNRFLYRGDLFIDALFWSGVLLRRLCSIEGTYCPSAGFLAALIYERVTRNVNSTDLTVNNAHAGQVYIYLGLKIYFRRMCRSLGDGWNLRTQAEESIRAANFEYALLRHAYFSFTVVKDGFTRARRGMHSDTCIPRRG